MFQSQQKQEGCEGCGIALYVTGPHVIIWMGGENISRPDD